MARRRIFCAGVATKKLTTTPAIAQIQAHDSTRGVAGVLQAASMMNGDAGLRKFLFTDKIFIEFTKVCDFG
jgi:hypothetical protein